MNIHNHTYQSRGGWTEADDEELKLLKSRGFSMSAIGQAMNRSRSSVAGRAYRLGLCERGLKTRVYPKIRQKAQQKRPPRPAPKPRPIVLDEPESFKLALDEIDTNQCRYISGDPLHMGTFCGHETVPLTDWCPYHLRVVYKPVRERDRV